MAAVGFSRVTSGDIRYFFSKHVKIFPCTYRNYYKSQSAPTSATGELSATFDPESRLISEYNYTHLPGIVSGKESYVVEYVAPNTEAGHPGSMKFVIGGYYFELSSLALDAKPDAVSEEITSLAKALEKKDNVSLVINLRRTPISSEQENNVPDTQRFLHYLAPLYGESLDEQFNLEAGEVNEKGATVEYYCTALGLKLTDGTPTSQFYSGVPTDGKQISLVLKSNGKIVYDNFISNIEYARTENSGVNNAINDLANLELGKAATARGENSIAIGTNASTYEVTYDTTGRLATETNFKQAIAIGPYANAFAENSLAVGYSAKTTGRSSIAIGSADPSNRLAGVTAAAEGSIVIGQDSATDAAAKDSIIIGRNVSASALEAIVIGEGNTARSSQEILIGNGLTSVEAPQNSIIGNYNNPAAGEATAGQLAIGTGIEVTHADGSKGISRFTSCVFGQKGVANTIIAATDREEPVASQRSGTIFYEPIRVKEDAFIERSTTIGGDISIKRNTTVAKNLTVGKATALNDTLTVQKSTKLQDKLTVDKETELGSSLNVRGSTILNSTVTAVGAFKAENTAEIQKQLTVKSINADDVMPVFTARSDGSTRSVSINTTDFGVSAKNLALAADSITVQAGTTKNLPINQLIFEVAHPVNSLFMTVDSSLNTATAVKNYFKTTFGAESEWEAWATDKVPMSAGTKHVLGSSGGAESFNLAIGQLPSHNHTASCADSSLSAHGISVTASTTSAGGHTHTIHGAGNHSHGMDENGWHQHYLKTDRDDVTPKAEHLGLNNQCGSDRNDVCHGAGSHTHGIHEAGGHDHGMDTSGAHTHTVNCSATVADHAAHKHSVTIASTGSGESISLMQPWQACYIYKRKK